LFKPTADKLAAQAGEAIADAALPKVKALYEWVRAKLAPDSYRGVLLDGVQAEPDDTARQEILKAELAKLIARTSSSPPTWSGWSRRLSGPAVCG
jgi:hypothetical protein